MDKEKVQSAIREMEAVYNDPATPEDMKATIGVSLEQARNQLAEYERDPLGQRRLVDDCHVLLVEMRDSIVGWREMTFSGMNPGASRQIADHGVLIHSNEPRPVAEQTFEDAFLVFDYRTRCFNEMPVVVSYFNKLMQQPGALQYKALLMAVARDVDQVLEVVHLAREGAVTDALLRKAIQDSLRATYFLNPLVLHLTTMTENINDYFPGFLTDALLLITASWEQEEPIVQVVIEPVLEETTKPTPKELLEKGGVTGDGKIQVSIEGKAFNLDIHGYQKAQKEISELRKSEGLLHEQAHWMDKNRKFIREEYKKRIHFAEGTTEEQKEMVWDHLAVDTLMKNAGHKGLFEDGGTITFHDKVEAIAKNLVGKPVPKKYQKTEGKRFTKKTAHAAAERIAGRIVSREKVKAAKKMLLGGVVIHAPGNMHLMNLDNLDIHSAGGASVI